MLGGATLPAPYNATDGSVACTVGEDEVQEFTPNLYEILDTSFKTSAIHVPSLRYLSAGHNCLNNSYLQVLAC